MAEEKLNEKDTALLTDVLKNLTVSDQKEEKPKESKSDKKAKKD